jgi:hypothetical protein
MQPFNIRFIHDSLNGAERLALLLKLNTATDFDSTVS